MIVAICICSIFIALTFFDKDLKFYENSVQVAGKVVKVYDDEHNQDNKIVKVAYEVNDKSFSKNLDVPTVDASRYKPADVIQVFYDANNPKDCRLNTRSLAGMYIILGILILLDALAIDKLVMYILSVKTNKTLCLNGHFVMATLTKVQTVTSITLNSLNGEENYIIISRYIKDGTEYIFKSKKLKNNPQELIQNNEVKVFVDKKNYKKYLVDVEAYV